MTTAKHYDVDANGDDDVRGGSPNHASIDSGQPHPIGQVIFPFLLVPLANCDSLARRLCPSPPNPWLPLTPDSPSMRISSTPSLQI
ncbi:hypothetical protein TorRG33x02_163160 [Trema orientale]|uniref:Uncharacterized protein n=1 Tax=Trema orientale TaxID=63057 RepID=A0A2P5EQW5_TREOI|nr:hypothetical protein TorRG33x02_163160 [Trema orientale]